MSRFGRVSLSKRWRKVDWGALALTTWCTSVFAVN